jgi:hypothetical protein
VGAKKDLTRILFLPPLTAPWAYHGDWAAAFRAIESSKIVIFNRNLAVPAEDVLFKSAAVLLHMV